MRKIFPRVLVVEDNPSNQKVIACMLDKLGCRVNVASNGAEALEVIKCAPCDLILMDCHMPVMDGYTATKEIRRLQGSSGRLPIIAITADGTRESCLEAGMDDYVSKPFNMNALREILNRWVPFK